MLLGVIKLGGREMATQIAHASFDGSSPRLAGVDGGSLERDKALRTPGVVSSHTSRSVIVTVTGHENRPDRGSPTFLTVGATRRREGA